MSMRWDLEEVIRQLRTSLAQQRLVIEQLERVVDNHFGVLQDKESAQVSPITKGTEKKISAN